MSNVVTVSPRKSVTLDMADRFGMEAKAFEATIRATVFPSNAPPEEFAAFLLVAKQYNLNPILKEIYAFPKRGGGIVPIVSIDGWCNLINSHPAFDGMEFLDTHNEDGELQAIQCTIYRKDRSHPIAVTEYLSECYRQTDPWKMKHRMLRHKATIQCARYAFAFAGIYDEDEAERIASAAPSVPAGPPAPPPLSSIAPPTKAAPAPAEPSPSGPMFVLSALKESLDKAENADHCNLIWDQIIENSTIRLNDQQLDDATAMLREAVMKFEVEE